MMNEYVTKSELLAVFAGLMLVVLVVFVVQEIDMRALRRALRAARDDVERLRWQITLAKGLRSRWPVHRIHLFDQRDGWRRFDVCLPPDLAAMREAVLSESGIDARIAVFRERLNDKRFYGSQMIITQEGRPR